MVKFGRHLSFFVQTEQYTDSQHYVVPYNYLRDKIIATAKANSSSIYKDPYLTKPKSSTSPFWCLRAPENNKPPPHTEESFIIAWHEVLSAASSSFAESTRSCWQKVYSTIAATADNPKEVRGAPLETALQIYATTVGLADATDMFVALKAIQSTARVNAEALRKLVKKYDKQVQGSSSSKLSELLLPELYGSIVALGQGTVDMAVEIIRCVIEDIEHQIQQNGKEYYSRYGTDGQFLLNDQNQIRWEYEETKEPLKDHSLVNGQTPGNPSSHMLDSSTTLTKFDEKIQSERLNEIQWLNSFTSQMAKPLTILERLVAHRGFHDSNGDRGARPLENSLAAYEAAWSAGIHLCECDVALTRDEKVVLAHDETFSRLALDPDGDVMASRNIGDLTLRELIALTLKNGVRAPLLVDVLRSAAMIGGKAQLIVEIKPGNADVAVAVARMLGSYPELIPRVALIMSFDLWCIHLLRNELTRVTGAVGGYYTDGGLSGIGVEDGDGFTKNRVSVSMLHVTSTPGFANMGLLSRPSTGLLGPPRASFTSSGGGVFMGNKYPSNAFLPGMGVSSPKVDFPSTGMLAQSYNSSHLLTMDEDDGPVSSRTNSGGTSGEGLSEMQTMPPEPPAELTPLALSSKETDISHSNLPPNLIPLSQQEQQPKPPVTMKLPYLMLLTTATTPEHPSELYVDIEDPSRLDGWLEQKTGKLDGVYIRYQPKMKEPRGAAALKALTSKYTVGIWLLKGDPDDFETMHYLTEECGVTFVNSDLPRDFFHAEGDGNGGTEEKRATSKLLVEQ